MAGWDDFDVMKIMFSMLGLAALAGVFMIVPSAHATVGGPSYIYGIRIGDIIAGEARTVAYIKDSQGGTGYPPSIYSVDIETGEQKVVVSGATDDTTAYDVQFRRYLAAHPTVVSRVSLPSFNVRARVVVTAAIEEDEIYYRRTEFSTSIFQDDEKKTTIAYSGCMPDQPHIFEGYAIPQSDSIALVVSTVGDCFEGGYTDERLFIVPDVRIADAYRLEAKGDEPAVADADGETGNLLVFAADETEPSPFPAPPPVRNVSSESPFSYYQILMIILALLIGTGVGYMLGKFKS